MSEQQPMAQSAPTSRVTVGDVLKALALIGTLFGAWTAMSRDIVRLDGRIDTVEARATSEAERNTERWSDVKASLQRIEKKLDDKDKNAPD